ncbi:hypothetical protein [Streptomyces koyangensis]|uniref:Uncharacterized protein n=1 Tax=Streptomyces koyangensis TaxID=188770 RepID=A0A385DJL5_9ACTN|nr:hypothetical protein [Streptomyces koyangensis]AXQ57971.1 hypothetical protein D0C37_27475 [Streptomyces koyangensis]
MSELSFELRRSTNTVTSREQRHVAFWGGTVGRLGTVELVMPALEVVPVRDRDTDGAAVTGESVPPSSFTGLGYGGRPRLARARLQVAGQEAELSRNAWRAGREGRALRIRVVGREYRYQERGNRRHHVLERTGARVEMTRSSASAAAGTLRGAAGGAVDSVDLSLAILLEGVYTRNLSLRGALISAPGRLLDRLGG